MWIRTNWRSQTGFIRNVFMVISGLGIGHVIVFISMPILSRQYSPSDFGLWSVMRMAISYLTMIATLKYELAIPLEKEEDNLALVIRIPLVSAVMFSVIVFGIWWGIKGNLYHAFGIEEKYWLVIPLGMLFSAWGQTFSYVAIRKERFKIIASYNIIRRIVQVSIPMGLAIFYKIEAWGLLLGEILSRLLGTLFLLVQFPNLLKLFVVDISEIRQFWQIVKKYQNFAIFTMPAAMINNLLFVSPVYFMSFIYGNEEAGFFSLTQSVLLGPLLLLSQGVAQVFFGRVSTTYREQPEQVYSLFWRTFKTLFFVGLIPSLVLILWGPYLFGLVFGDQWVKSGVYARLLMVGVLAQFCVGPVYQSLNIVNGQKFIAISGMISVGLFAVVALEVYFQHLSSEVFVGLYSVIIMIDYSLLLIFTFLALKKLKVSEKN